MDDTHHRHGNLRARWRQQPQRSRILQATGKANGDPVPNSEDIVYREVCLTKGAQELFRSISKLLRPGS